MAGAVTRGWEGEGGLGVAGGLGVEGKGPVLLVVVWGVTRVWGTGARGGAWRIVTRKSVEGISFIAILSELLIYTVNLAYNVHYNYPFNTYGDLAVSWFVLIFVLVLMQVYKRFDSGRVALVTALSSVWCLVLFSNSLPVVVLSSLQAASGIGLAFGSRIPQIWLNFKKGSTGELSIIMFIANALGCLIRVFTTISLTQDNLLLFNAAFHLVLNAIIIVQCVGSRLDSAREQEKLEGMGRSVN